MAKWIKEPFTISLILLLVIGGIISWLKFKPEKEISTYIDNVDQINKIEITHQGEKTTLSKKNDQWMVKSDQEKQADQQLVIDLLNKLKILKPQELVSQNPANHQKYGVTKESAIRLQIFNNGQNLLHIFVGKISPSYSNNYLREHKSNKVYLSNTGLRSSLMPSSWVRQNKESQNEVSK